MTFITPNYCRTVVLLVFPKNEICQPSPGPTGPTFPYTQLIDLNAQEILHSHPFVLNYQRLTKKKNDYVKC